MLVTNMWSEVSHDVGEAREYELSSEFFKQAIYKGAQVARHHDTTQSAHGIIRMLMMNRPIALRIQWELVDKGKDIADTAAGVTINKELNEQIKKHRAELKKLQDEMTRAITKKDKEVRHWKLEEEGENQLGQMGRRRVEAEFVDLRSEMKARPPR